MQKINSSYVLATLLFGVFAQLSYGADALSPPIPPSPIAKDPASALAAKNSDTKCIPKEKKSTCNNDFAPATKRALKLSHSTLSGNKNTDKPIEGANGIVRFVFGQSNPTIVCAVLQVCDLELESGEHVNNIALGDTARWSLSPSVSGFGADEIEHAIIKPFDSNLQTSLIIATNRRTYHIQLISDKKAYMPFIGFIYPETALMQWEILKAHQLAEKQTHDVIVKKEIATKTLPDGEYLGNLHFNYTIKGNARWTPLRVYNNGVKTIIQMPESMSQSEAPVLLVVRKDQKAKKGEGDIVNYRLINNRYIVDSVFNKAILIAGIGDSQQIITITRGNND